MTLFETTLPAVEDIATRRTAHLPTPTKSRFMPLRAGVLNVWEYDDQQFWFADGRLLLRGRNEAGKSKVLELLFPFVLDGDISPKKLDPFDTANKSMWWNMIGFHKDRAAAIGYLWLEFGRIDDAGAHDFVTVIVGVQATRAEKKVNTWFAVTPQRIDVDLDLNPGEVCRSQDSFVGAIGPAGRFTTKAGGHRANVASMLFGMGSERFDNLLHLLRQLRKPKLADKLDNKKLSAVLTDALPPLDDSRIEPLANGFGFLDADVEDLRRTEAAHRATATFLGIYRNYARTQVRQRADDVRGAVSRFDGVTREEREHTTALEDAQAESERLAREASDLAHKLAAAVGSLEGLDLTAVESLRSLEQIAGSHAMIAANLATQHAGAVENAALARTDAQAKTATAAEEAAAVLVALGNARRAANAARLVTGWEHADDHTVSARQLADAVRTRASLVEAVDEADRRSAGARAKISAATQRVESADGVRQAAADELTAATSAATSAQTHFADAVDLWIAAAPTITPETDGCTVIDELTEHIDQGAQRATRELADRLVAPAVELAGSDLDAATSRTTEAGRQQRQARHELDTHDALPTDPPPPGRPGIATTRTDVPFWFAVEFNDNVDSTDAAMLEAALTAAGFLDAIVSDSGLIDLDTDDTILVADSELAHGLHDWLHPAEGSDTDLINRIISSIGAGPGTNHKGWIDIDGTWGNGQLTGRWSKSAVEHIGAGARAAAKARRRSELTDALAAAEHAVSVAAEALDGVRATKTTVDAWVKAFPDIEAWVGAARDVRTASKAVAVAEGEHRRAVENRQEIERAVEAAFAAVELAIRNAECQPDDVPAARAALAAAADLSRDLGNNARSYARSEPAALDARRNADRLETQAAQVAERLEGADLTAATSKAKFDTAVELEGADVARVLAEKDRLEADITTFRLRQQAVNAATGAARETVGRAETVLEETGRRRVRATMDRDAALVALAAVVRTGHVSLAVTIDATRDPSDYLQATAGRTLARQIATAVDDNEATSEARNRATDRLVKEFNTLRNEVGADFDPHLDTEADLFVASATLNGDVIGIAELHRALGDDAEQRRLAIAAEERALIEQHLRDEVGNHLGNCLHAAATQVKQMNSILRDHPTNSGATVQLHWEVDDTGAGPSVRAAVQALLTAPSTRDESASAVLATFLGDRVGVARRGEIEGADLAERLTNALDYRRWYHFKLGYKTRGGEGELTAKSVGAGSGGQQAKVGHLPLLAAAAGFYSSSDTAPRLCFLDEAFAGIDGPNTADLLAVSVKLDLDMVMTNYDAWFCVPEVPGLAIYHLEKLPDTVGVAAIRYEWDGDRQQELDLWLDG